MIRSVALAAVTASLAAAPALGAPARSHAFGLDATAAYSWDSGNGAGIALTQAISDRVGCQLVVNCDTTLVRIDDAGTLVASTSTADATLVDLDFYLYESDKDGAQLDEIASSTAFTPAESLAADLDPGYYLLRAEWAAGAGSYHGDAGWTPRSDEEEL